jgi:hypothetical protein
MFFSKSARILAVIAIVVGLLSVLLGTAAVTGIYAVLFAVALGTLAEISVSLHRWSTV